jgi:peroxiredoxin Q/BCP
MRLEPGDKAPSWKLPTADGKKLGLADLKGKKVILYAYPAAMTPGCTTQACDFRDSLASLQAHGYAVVGISPDSPESSPSLSSATRSPSRWSPTPTRAC